MPSGFTAPIARDFFTLPTLTLQPTMAGLLGIADGVADLREVARVPFSPVFEQLCCVLRTATNRADCKCAPFTSLPLDGVDASDARRLLLALVVSVEPPTPEVAPSKSFVQKAPHDLSIGSAENLERAGLPFGHDSQGDVVSNLEMVLQRVTRAHDLSLKSDHENTHLVDILSHSLSAAPQPDGEAPMLTAPDCLVAPWHAASSVD